MMDRVDEPRRGGRLPDPGMGAICGRCGEPREAHGGPLHLGACPGESGIDAKRFSIEPGDRPNPEWEEPERLPLPPRPAATMDDLVAWLPAQLDNDERLVERNRGQRGLGDDGNFPDYRTYDGEDLDAADDYLARFSPKRMAAEVEAKRRIIAMHEGRHWCTPEPEDTDWQVIEAAEPVTTVYPCLHLRTLALPYADRSGYREEWRP